MLRGRLATEEADGAPVLRDSAWLWTRRFADDPPMFDVEGFSADVTLATSCGDTLPADRLDFASCISRSAFNCPDFHASNVMKSSGVTPSCARLCLRS